MRTTAQGAVTQTLSAGPEPANGPPDSYPARDQRRAEAGADRADEAKDRQPHWTGYLQPPTGYRGAGVRTYREWNRFSAIQSSGAQEGRWPMEAGDDAAQYVEDTPVPGGVGTTGSGWKGSRAEFDLFVGETE